MSEQFTIEPEAAKALSAREECALLREGLRRNPDSGLLRLRLAKILNLMDAFDESIALLREPPLETLGIEELLALAQALLARRTSDDAHSARDVAERALKVAALDTDRSTALAQAAKAAFRLGETAPAVELLEEALRLDPNNAAACKRLATYWLGSGSPGEVLALADRLAAQGVDHSRVLTSRMLALAKVGKVAEARRLLNLPEFLHAQLLAPPPPWNDVAAFNAALAAELSAHPGLRYGRYGTASHNSWRIDSPATGSAPAARALVAGIAEAARRHVAALPDSPHPWLAARPKQVTLASWCVITEAEGYEDWHTHPEGWMSGVYYVEVPDAVAHGTSDGGCLELGLPAGLVGREAATFGRELVRPQAGLTVLFPSHGYHRTYPHGSSERRICISFDLRPA